jgi:NitT/TauT family transport system substrate-binding protein
MRRVIPETFCISFKRRIFVIRWFRLRSPAALGLIAAAALLVACGQAPAPTAAPPASATQAGSAAAQPTAAAGAMVHVKMATTAGATGNAPLYIAMARGYFQQQGIDLETVDFPGGAQMIPAIAASQVDIANTDAGAGLLNAIAHNLPARFVADGASCTVGHCTASFVVRKSLVDSGAYKDVADLRGKNVNTFTPGSTLYLYLYRMLQKAGLKDTDINTQVLTFDQITPAFVTGAIDASWLIDPFTTQSVLQGVGTKIGDAAEILGPQQSTVILYAPNFAAQQKEAGKQFMVAYLKGVRDYDTAFVDGVNKDEMLNLLVNYTSIKDPAQLAKIGMPNFDHNGKIIIDSVKANQDWYVGHGDVPQPINLDEVYDTSYIDYANGVIGG